MATVTETAGSAKASRNDIEAYRQSVFDDRCDSQINFAVRRTDYEWRKDRQTYESRVTACERLKDLPRLQGEADRLRSALRGAEAFARSPIADGMSIGSLVEKIRAEIPEFQHRTPPDLADAIRFCCDTGPLGRLGKLRFSLGKAERAISESRDRAQQVLVQTGSGEWPPAEVKKIGRRIEAVQARINGRREILEAEAKAADLRRQCEQLARGERPATGMTYTASLSEPRSPIVAAYRAARKRLDAVMDMLALKPSAEESQRADEAELATLQVKAADARQAAIQRLADPTNMKWVGDDE